MTILYDIIFILAFSLYFPVLVIKGKWHPEFRMRLGSIPPELKAKLARKPNVWFHAVSVGEVLAVTGLVEEIRKSYPQYQIVLSTVTTTGYQLAASRLADNDLVIYAPLDLSFIVHRYIQAINPQIYISAETEIWPNLFAALGGRRVPIVQVNGRISEKSFKNYFRIKFLLKDVLQAVTVFCMQSSVDAGRIRQLGVEPGKIVVTGNMKFDDAPRVSETALVLSYQPHELVWVAGSTHPGEEKIILDVFKSLQTEFSDLRLIMAPRHVERAPEVFGLIAAEGFKPFRFSRLSEQANPSYAVIVVDTIGHLRALYQLATVVFIGKSLTGQGGQNIIEPAFFAKPMIVGPNMQNFRNILTLFQDAQAIVQIKSATELLPAMQKLLRDPPSMKKTGESAKQVIEKNQGATLKTHQIISRILPAQ